MKIKDFILVNEEKVERALNGVPDSRPNSAGQSVGGVGQGAYFDGVWKRDGEDLSEAEVDKLESAILAEYDKLGGLIKRGDDTIKTGSFYDIKARTPRKEPKIIFTFRDIKGRYVEVPDGVELPREVKAAKIRDQKEPEEEEETDE